MSPSPGRRLAAPLVLLLCCAVAAEAQTSGQELADAVAAFGRTNLDTTVQLPPGVVSLRTARFSAVVGAGAWSAGSLTLRGANTSSSGERTALDAAMRVELVPTLRGATLTLQDLWLANLCTLQVPLGPGLVVQQAASLAIFAPSRSYRSISLKNVTLLLPPAHMRSLVYLAIVQSLLAFAPGACVRARVALRSWRGGSRSVLRRVEALDPPRGNSHSLAAASAGSQSLHDAGEAP